MAYVATDFPSPSHILSKKKITPNIPLLADFITDCSMVLVRLLMIVLMIQEGWCDSVGSVEDIQAKLLKRQEAAAKRERAMAYALAHQVEQFHPSLLLYILISFPTYCYNGKNCPF